MKFLLSFCFLFLIPNNAFAEVNSGDTAWILTSTALVLLMTLPGLAYFTPVSFNQRMQFLF